jgi:hypothetical protein
LPPLAVAALMRQGPPVSPRPVPPQMGPIQQQEPREPPVLRPPAPPGRQLEEAAAGAAGVAVTGDAGGLAAGAGMIAFTACWQPEESLATLSFRHCSASFPPLGTPEQFAMKSERQFERIALCWSEVGSCAAAMPAPPAKPAISNTTQTAARIGVLFKDFMWLLVLLDSFLGVV